jgi:hypothetical protein
MGNKYRVAHVGTGYTGAIALRQILRSPRLELVGHLVNTREKVGRDSGELVGESAVGVAATDSIVDFLALDADCVTYFAAISGRDTDDIVDQLCGFLASGKNVVTPSYPALFHPGWTLDEIREHREVATADRHYSFAAGEIPAGTIASVRMRFDGIVEGEPRVQYSSIWSLPDEPVEDWQPVIAADSATRRLTRITVDGDPPVQLDFALNGGELPGSAATAARVVNAIPAVCAADPGILSALDLVVAAG